MTNRGDTAANNVTIELVSNNPTVTVLAPATANLGAAEAFTPLATPVPFRVQLAASMSDDQLASLDIVVRFSGGSDLHSPFNLVVSKVRSCAEVVKPVFSVGEMKADPARNVVYLINKSGRRIFALDTALGRSPPAPRSQTRLA